MFAPQNAAMINDRTVGRWLAAAENEKIVAFKTAGDEPPPYKVCAHNTAIIDDLTRLALWEYDTKPIT